MRIVEIRFERSAFEEYKELESKTKTSKNSKEARILDAINKILDDLKVTMQNNETIRIGRSISVSKLSSRLAKQLKRDGINIIWSVELPEAWRMVYAVSGDEIRIIAFVLHLSDHKDYERFLNQ